MKKLILTLIFALCGTTLWADVPQKMGYQMLVLDPQTGSALKMQEVNVKLEIRQGGADGTVVYTLSKTVTTNKMGTCNVTLEPPSTINWNYGPFFLATYVNDRLLSCTQLLSVPFAFQANTVTGWPTKEELIGTWKINATSSDTGYSYTFNGDGTCTYSSGGDGFHGTWKVLPGNLILLELIRDTLQSSENNYTQFIMPYIINGKLYMALEDGTYRTLNECGYSKQ